MTLTSVNISVIILMLIFQSTFASDSHLLFPEEFPKERLVKCGFDHEIYGISILDGYLYQFERCAMIIYPPPLNQRLNENLDHLKFDNGYRYNYSEIIPITKANICEMASLVNIYENNSPIFLLNHLIMPNNTHNQQNKKAREQHDNHYILYFVGAIYGQWVYRTYDFNTMTYEGCQQWTDENEFHYIMLTNGNEVMQIVNDRFTKEAYALKGDCITNTQGKEHGYICMRQADDGKNYLISLKFSFHECEESNLQLAASIMDSIAFTLTVYNKIAFISKIEQKVYITDFEFLQWLNRNELLLQIKSLKDFFICTEQKNPTNIQPSKQENTTTTKEEKPKIITKFKNKIFIIITVLIVIIVILINGIIIVIYMNRDEKIKKSNVKMKTKSLLSLNLITNKEKYRNTIRSKLSQSNSETSSSDKSNSIESSLLMSKKYITKNKEKFIKMISPKLSKSTPDTSKTNIHKSLSFGKNVIKNKFFINKNISPKLSKSISPTTTTTTSKTNIQSTTLSWKRNFNKIISPPPKLISNSTTSKTSIKSLSFGKNVTKNKIISPKLCKTSPSTTSKTRIQSLSSMKKKSKKIFKNPK